MEALHDAIKAGIIVYNVSQCNGGRVLQGRYSTSKRLQEMGVVSGADITTEAALAKLQFLLSKELNYPQIVSELSTSIRGEMA
jgi:L-asparaginase